MKALYLDDESEILELAQLFFSDRGILLDTTNSPTRALEMAASTAYDLILSDARMPELSGLEFCVRLRDELGFRGCFILISGHFDFSDLSHVPAGIDGVIMKPVDFEELLGFVETLEL